MALVIADRVRETTTTTGTGTLTLAGPYTGFQAFSVIGNGNTTYYAIIDASTGAWEVGIGTYTSSGNLLSRDTILASSNSGSAVNFGAGTKDVIITQPAERAVFAQSNGSGLQAGVAAFTANGVPYANSTSTLTTGSALTFDGTNLAASGVVKGSGGARFEGAGSLSGTGVGAEIFASGGVTYYSSYNRTGSAYAPTIYVAGTYQAWNVSGEQMRLTSTGLTTQKDATIQGITVGRGAGAVSTNTAVGASALAANTTGAYTTGVGNAALQNNTSGAWNSALGFGALNSNSTGSNNVAVGGYALVNNTTASNNTAVGYQARYGSDTESANTTAIGYQAMYMVSATTADATQSVAVGVSALGADSSTTALLRYNVAVGTNAMRLYSNTTGTNQNNVAVGLEAMYCYNNTTGTNQNNVAVGQQALYAQQGANNNTAVGYQAGYTISTGNNNVFVGAYAGNLVTTGSGNTFVGRGPSAAAGDQVTSGSKNTILGAYTGNNGGLDIRTASNYIVLSDGDGNPRAICNTDGNWILGTTGTLGSGTARLSIEGAGGVVVGIKSTGGSGSECTWQWNNATTGNNLFTSFITETTATARGSISYNRGSGVVAYNTTSDYRAKDIIGEVQNALATVAQLKPWMGVMKDATVERPMFVAHEAQAVAPYAVVGEKDAVKEDGTPDFQQMDHSTLVPLLTAAIQELKADLDATKAELAALKGA